MDPDHRQDQARHATGLPICVDLDGTLIRTDSLVEQLVGLLRAPRRFLRAMRSLFEGRAAFKARVAELSPSDPSRWPYNEELLSYLRAERATGRSLVLATAADRSVANGVAGHLGLFDEVLASNGSQNLKAGHKARALVDRFGRGGFLYAGDARADIPVWRESGGAVLVHAGRGTRRAIGADVEVVREFRGPSRLGSTLRLLRPHQWAKNALVFAPMVASGQFTVDIFLPAAIAFVAFSLVASGLYVWNDLLDVTADRAHPRKSRRPLAAGDLPLSVGIVLVPLLLVLGSMAGAGAGILWLIGLYALGSASYSAVLKTFPLVDIFTLGGLYTVRLLGGGVASSIELSVWLIGVSSFLFLGLAAMKRVSELRRIEEQPGGPGRRGYYPSDLAVLEQIGIAAAFASTVVLALYVQSDVATSDYAEPRFLWLLVPLLLFWECRLWLATGRGYMHDDPVAYSLKDWVSWCAGIGIGLTLILARFGFG